MLGQNDTVCTVPATVPPLYFKLFLSLQKKIQPKQNFGSNGLDNLNISLSVLFS